MIVSKVYSNLRQAIENILDALANRLTAGDNWGPEGNKGQVLTSNGPGPDDPPPSFQDIAGLITGNPTLVETITGPTGPPGPQGPAGVDGGGGVPLTIAEDESFTVPENVQMVFSEPIDVDGELVIDGVLAMVD